MQVPIAYISSLILVYLNILYVCFFIVFWVFFKVNSEVFLHNTVATLIYTKSVKVRERLGDSPITLGNEFLVLFFFILIFWCFLMFFGALSPEITLVFL